MSFQLRSDIYFGTFLVHYTHELDADLPILNHTNEKQVHLTKVLGIQGGSSLQGVVHGRIWKFQKKKTWTLLQSISYQLSVLVNRLMVLANVDKLTKNGMS